MRNLKSVYLTAVAIIGLAVTVSCAGSQDNPYSGMSQETFDAWIAKYAPETTKLESGVYIYYYERADNWESLDTATIDTSWLRMSYTGKNTSNDIFVTRYDSTARLLGTWLYTTHFVDNYLLYSEYTTNICSGLYDALSYMRAGDSVAVYIPSSLTYTTYAVSSNSAYLNSSVTYQYYPVIFNIALKEIVNDPYELELQRLNEWVAQNWGMSESDTIREGLYYRVLTENPDVYDITVDSSVTYWSTNYFLEDDQLISTNIQDTATYYGYYDSDESYYATSVDFSYITEPEEDDEDGVVEINTTDATYQAIPAVMRLMRQGEKVEIVATSLYCAGVYGSTTSTPEILPYQSQRFIIETVEDSDDDDDDDDEDDDDE